MKHTNIINKDDYLKLKEYLLDKNINIDIYSSEDNKLPLIIDIGVPINDEIDNNLYKFGFIKYSSTQIRYVGLIPAKIIYENNLTLEEYLKDFGTILFINKPKGITSFDVVHEISKLFGIKKVGHTGTLDPMATGVMLIAIGKATKIVELLTAEDKEYIAKVKLGIETDTLDIEGKVLKEEYKEVNNLKEIVNSYNNKTYLQEVPIFSAIKVKGKKLYDYARNNIEVELPKKEVTIKEIELLEEDKEEFTIKTLVSKGTYIRSLVRDICNDLDTIGVMTELIRIKQGNISIEDTNTIDEIKNNNFKLHNIESILPYPIIEVDNTYYKKISNGMKLTDKWKIKDKVIFRHKNKVLGIYEKDNDILRVWKNFI